MVSVSSQRSLKIAANKHTSFTVAILQQQLAVCGKFAFGRDAAGCVSALTGLVTLTFDLLTLKLVCESHLRWGTFSLNLGTLGLRVLELFAMYATDGRTDERTDEHNA